MHTYTLAFSALPPLSLGFATSVSFAAAAAIATSTF
jgi:hypothetical protein